MYFHPLFLIVPTLIAVFVGAMSFAMVGRGYRLVWMLVAPLVTLAWFILEQIIVLLVSTDKDATNPLSRQLLVAIFWRLCLPAVLCLTANAFRRWREQVQYT
jgi:hypothetical protein